MLMKEEIKKDRIDTEENKKLMKELLSKSKIKEDGSIVVDSIEGETKIGSYKMVPPKITEEEAIIEMGKCYEMIIEILDEYMDIDKKLYPLLSCWIIGTYFHTQFPSYPYLFINAMKGSGKTRLLNIIKNLSWRGDLLNSPTEAVLFRTEGTLCIDEFEGVTRRGNENLRELLNSAYKRGTKVKRMRKKTTMDGDQQVVEEFDVYRPIVIANIWGMETVLADRCLSFVLDKSNNPLVTRLVEIFDMDDRFEAITHKLCSLCNVVTSGKVYRGWNYYLKNRLLYTHTTLTNNYTNYKDIEINKKYLEFFNKIFDTGINGRNLELSLPLFVIANKLGDDILKNLINVMKEVVFERKEEDYLENKDVAVIDFVSQEIDNNFFSVTSLLNKFRTFIGAKDEDRWLNSRWFGRSLKRLNLVLDKRRKGRGIEVMLNIKQAKEKIKMFKTE